MKIYIIKVENNLEPYFFTNLTSLYNYFSENNSMFITEKIPVSYSTFHRLMKKHNEFSYYIASQRIYITSLIKFTKPGLNEKLA